MERDCIGLVALAAVSDWSIPELDLPQVSEDSVDQAGGSSVPDGVDSNMASRRTNPRESERIRNRVGGVSAERIRSGDSAARIKSGSPTGSEGHDRPPKKAKTNGADHRLGVSGDTAKEANNEFAATLERRLQDVPRSDELNEIKKVVRELKLGLKMAQDQERANAAQLAAAENLGNQAASLEAVGVKIGHDGINV
ncbi:hypothetical protein F2Q69_00023076 [Brassica cretica]|uniref:Uncharacterized protein n=1 Tax=Brassica cretica TaxID=69181 RepID=A0A8S9QEJ6_BRACR|nr:hypothetical protein F2Q69_00023076 [Brassica cretica]